MNAPPRTLLFVLIGAAGSAVAANPGFIIVPPLPGARSTYVTGIGQDGSQIAGRCWTGFTTLGFRYGVSSGILEPLVGNPMFPEIPTTSITGSSSDGSFLAGQAVGPSGEYGAARIRPGQAPDYIGRMPGDRWSEATSISGDGRVVVGESVRDDTGLETTAFRWTPEGGLQSLGSLFGVHNGKAWDVSRDGTTIVGTSANGGFYDKPFVWRESTGMEALPTLGGIFAESAGATTVSADGSTIFGYDNYDGQTGSGFVRWIGGVAEELPGLPGTRGILPHDTSDTGSVTVGTLVHIGEGTRGFVWTEATGMMFPENYLSMHGVNIPSGVLIDSIGSISGDGLTFGGIMQDGRGFVAVIPAVPSSVLMGIGLWAVGLRRRRSM